MDYRVLFHTASAGFPSPGEPWRERRLDLHDLLILDPAATFFVQVQGHSMQGAGIYDGDIVIVDRSLPAVHNTIIVALLGETFLIKRLQKVGTKIFLKSEHHRYPTFEVRPTMPFQIWGVVTVVLHGVHPTLSLSALQERRRRRMMR